MHTGTRRGRVMARLAPLALLGVVALTVTACSGGTSTGSSSIKVTDPWARTSAMVSGAGAAYMVIENTGSAADALTGGTSDVATAVEVHETVVMGTAAPMESPAMGGGMESPMASDGGMASGGGMMGMQKIDRLEIPAGGTVELKPGGYHIMLIGLTRELKAGEEIEITLTFEKAGDVTLKIPVREQ
jgi:copper(I)-binding protein